jgi:hypothetical protein
MASPKTRHVRRSAALGWRPVTVEAVRNGDRSLAVLGVVDAIAASVSLALSKAGEPLQEPFDRRYFV